jgi:hypothetical protein
MLWYNQKSKDAEEGFLGFAEGSYKFQKLHSDLRLQYFETDGYNSRIYAYENDVLYSFSIPAFLNKGFRYYLSLSYDLNKRLTGWLKWAQTIYQGQSKVSSGLDEIDGNTQSRITLQLQMSF